MTQPIMLVTGGSRGIGAATAIIAAARGYRVALTYQSQSAAADAVVQTISEAGGDLVHIVEENRD